MPRFSARTYINEDFIGRGPQHANHGAAIADRYENGLVPGDYLTEGPVLAVDAADEKWARDLVWVIGNRMGWDANGRQWPSYVRSLSVGDVVLIGETAWTALALGWRQLTTVELEHALCTQCPQCERHAHLRPQPYRPSWEPLTPTELEAEPFMSLTTEELP